MKKIFLSILILLTVLVTSFCFFNRDKIVFHAINFSSSDIRITKWFIKDTANVNFVEERIDFYGRTKELRFYNDMHKLNWVGSGYYGGPIIKYEYFDDRIIETFFSSESDIANDFKTSEVPYRHIYYIEDDTIKSVDLIYKIDFRWNKECLDSTINHLKAYQKYNSVNSELTSIFGYDFASAKYCSVNPKKR
jgi:hypothetical protein